jgi:transcriptional regulator with XRE-family HTH domain
VASNARLAWPGDLKTMGFELKLLRTNGGSVSQFGSSLRRLAGLHGLNHRQLAVLLDLSEQSISELTSGRREPGLQTVRKVAETFEVDALKAQDGIQAILDQVGDRERFERVEKKISRVQRQLKAVN